MAGVGGYEAPRNPAPASGPGKLARRTDGGPAQSQATYTGLPYGQAGALAAQQRGAPMSQADSVPSMSVTGLNVPSLRPNEPVTAGVDIGAGPGSEALGATAQTPTGELSGLLYQLSATDRTGSLAALAMAALSRGL